jgi:hypothetical protein
VFSGPIGEVNVQSYLRYNYVGKRFVDLFNLTELPAYDTLAAGLIVQYRTWTFQVVGDNITNARGLTDGNRRDRTLASGAQIVSTDYLTRPTVHGNDYDLQPFAGGWRCNPLAKGCRK